MGIFFSFLNSSEKILNKIEDCESKDINLSMSIEHYILSYFYIYLILPDTILSFIISLVFSSRAACAIFDILPLDLSLFSWVFQKSSSLSSASRSIYLYLSGKKESI